MSKRNIINLFATRSDFEPGLQEIESRHKLQYVLCGLFDDAGLTVYGSLLDAESFGTSTSPDHMAGPRYLVMDAFRRVDVRSVPQRRGGIKYAIDQLANPGSITVLPGGLYQDSCLLAGQIGTVAEDSEAIELFRNFSRLVTRGFKKIRGYSVGPGALELLEQGVRLTTHAKSPPEYDLAR